MTGAAATGSNPVWNEQFAILVEDPQISQLELTLWDMTTSTRRTKANLLGEVVVNLSKLVNLHGQLVEHDFDVRCRQLSQHDHTSGSSSMGTNGTIRLVLRLVEQSFGSEFDMAALKSIAASLHSTETHALHPLLQRDSHLDHQRPAYLTGASGGAGSQARGEGAPTAMPTGWEEGEIAILAVAVLEAAHVPFLHADGAEVPLLVEVTLGAHSESGQQIGMQMRKVSTASVDTGLRVRIDDQLMFHVPQVCVCVCV